MKRKCMSAILSAVTLLSVLPQMAFPAAAAKAKTLGDVNADGAVNVSDGVALSRYVAQWDDITVDKHAADLNQDGVIKKQDVTILVRYLAGWDGYDKYIQPIKTDIPDSLRIETQPKAVNTTADKLIPISAAAAGGTEPYTYQWLRNGIEIADATDAAYTPKICGDYRCMITDSEENAVMTHVAKADITPVISKQPSSNEVYLNITVTSGDTVTYLWQFRAVKTEEWVDLNDSDKTTYKPETLGYYRCIVTNDTDGKTLISDEVMHLAGEDFANHSSIVLDMPEGAAYGEEMDFGAGLSMKLQTGELPPAVPYAVTGFYGDTIRLRAEVIGIEPFTYEWQIADTYKDYIDGTNFRILDDKTDGCTGQGTSVLNYVLSDYDNSGIICDESLGVRTNGFIRCKVTDGVGNVAYVEYENKWNFDYNQWLSLISRYDKYNEKESYLEGARGLELCGVWDRGFEITTPPDLVDPHIEDMDSYTNASAYSYIINAETGQEGVLGSCDPGEYRIAIPFLVSSRFHKPYNNSGVDGVDYIDYAAGPFSSKWYREKRKLLNLLSDTFHVDCTRTYDLVLQDFDPTDENKAKAVLSFLAEQNPKYAGLDADAIYAMLPLRIKSGYYKESDYFPSGDSYYRTNYNKLESDEDATGETAYSAAIESAVEDESFEAVRAVLMKNLGCTKEVAARYLNSTPCGLPQRTNQSSATELVNALREAGANAHLLYLRDRMPEKLAVRLNSYTGTKVAAIKAVHEQLGIGLEKAQTLVNSIPCTVADDLTEQQAKQTAEALEEKGLSVTVVLSAKMMETIKGTRVTLFSYDESSKLAIISALEELLGISLKEAKDLLTQTPFVLYPDADDETVLNAAEKLTPLGVKLLYVGEYKPCVIENNEGVDDLYILQDNDNKTRTVKWNMTLSSDGFDGQTVNVSLEKLQEDETWSLIDSEKAVIKRDQFTFSHEINRSTTPTGTYRLHTILPNGSEAEAVFKTEIELCRLLSSSNVESVYVLNPYTDGVKPVQWFVALSKNDYNGSTLDISFDQLQDDGKTWRTLNRIQAEVQLNKFYVTQLIRASETPAGTYRLRTSLPNGNVAEAEFSIQLEKLYAVSQEGLRDSYRINPDGEYAILLPWKVTLSSALANACKADISWQKKLESGEWYTIDTKSANIHGNVLSYDYPMHTHSNGEFRLIATGRGGIEIISPTIEIAMDTSALMIDYQRRVSSQVARLADETLIYSIRVSGGTLPEFIDASLSYTKGYLVNNTYTTEDYEIRLNNENGELSASGGLRRGDNYSGSGGVIQLSLTVTDANGITYIIVSDREGIIKW